MVVRGVALLTAVLLSLMVSLCAWANVGADFVAVLSPNGGESILTGSEYSIRWRVADQSYSMVYLYYSCDGGETWQEIAGVSQVALEQEYRWLVPDTPTQEALVKVVCLAVRGAGYSDVSDAPFTIRRPLLPSPLISPTELTAVALGTDTIRLTWVDNAHGETGYQIERLRDSGWHLWDTAAANATSYTDTGLNPGQTCRYRVRACKVMDYEADEYSMYTNVAEATTWVELRLFINKTAYFVNDRLLSMDTVAIIREGRTLLPIRYVADSIGASVGWDPVDHKAVILHGERVVELWLNRNLARVDGRMVPIDPSNASVVPISVPPGRTMLPIRFVAETLGCMVGWDAKTQEVRITFSGW